MGITEGHTCSTDIHYNRGTGSHSGTADRALNIEKRKDTTPRHSHTQTKDRTTAKIELPKAGWGYSPSGSVPLLELSFG